MEIVSACCESLLYWSTSWPPDLSTSIKSNLTFQTLQNLISSFCLSSQILHASQPLWIENVDGKKINIMI